MDKYKKSLENLETMSERLYIPGVDIKEIVEHYKERMLILVVFGLTKIIQHFMKH